MNTSLVLSHKSEKNVSDFEQKSLMTTKELAKVLGVSERTIRETAKNKGVECTFHTLKTNGGNQSVKVFTEEQATIIKMEIQKHHNAGLKVISEGTRQIDKVSTEYEMELMTQKVLAYHAQKAAEYKARMEIAENALDRIANGKGCFSMGATAKKLHIKINGKELGRNNFIDFLKHENILMENGEPYQNQIQAEHFKTIITFINDKVGNKSVTLTTSKGIVYLAKKFNAEIDESVLSDYN